MSVRTRLATGRLTRAETGAVGITGVATATGAIFALEQATAVASLAVVYLLPVLAVSIYRGVAAGVITSLGSALCFNYFFLPPTGRLTIADDRNTVALLTFVVVAAVASRIAETARVRAAEAQERRREADLAAEMARTLLRGPELGPALAATSRRLSEVLGAASVSIELGTTAGDDRRHAVPLVSDDERLGTLVVPAALAPHELARVRERIVPALESILAAALTSERLREEVVETASLRRSDELKTALLRSVSHDLRTPLTTIVTAGEALRSASLDGAERREFEADIAEAATRLSTLIDRLLDLARLQSGNADPRPSWCSIDEVVREAAEQVTPEPARIQIVIPADLPLIRADAAQLERAFANLLDNALQHGAAGRPVSVHAHLVTDRVVVRVTDHGAGIPRHEQERIFSPFYRGPAATSVGSGLGLAIARGFVEANAGSVTVESLPGQGATFVVGFPLEPATVPALAAAEVT